MKIKKEDLKNCVKTIKEGNDKILSFKNINFWLKMIVFACILLVLTSKGIWMVPSDRNE
jgi:hypothetical protein